MSGGICPGASLLFIVDICVCVHIIYIYYVYEHCH